MPRRKPTEKLDTIGKLEKKVTDAVGEYLVSKESDRKEFLKPPNLDGFPETPESFYLSCVREYKILREVQKEILAENKRLDIVNAMRHEELCSDQVMLRSRFAQCATKLKELKQKEEFANSIKEHEALVQKLDKEKCAEHRITVQMLKQFRQIFQKTVNEYHIFEDFMKAFLKEYPSYGTPAVFINRMDALMLANVDINALNESLELQLQEMKTELMTITRDVANYLMRLKNELDFFQRAFVKVCYEVKELEEDLIKIKATWIKRENEKQRTIEGLYNVYLLLCKRKSMFPDLRTTDVDKICMYLKNEYDVMTFTYQNIEECSKNY